MSMLVVIIILRRIGIYIPLRLLGIIDYYRVYLLAFEIFMRHIQRLTYLIIFCLAIFSGTSLQFNGIFFQGYLFILSLLVYPAITYRSLIDVIKIEKLSSFLLVFSIVVTAIFALDLYEHVQASIRIFTIILSFITFYGVFKRDPKLVDLIYLILISVTGGLVLMEIMGFNFGFEVGERFGFIRPFLFANPITIGLMVSLISIYYLINNKKLFVFFAVPLSLVFSSATGIFALLIFYSRVLFFTLMTIIFVILVFGYQEDVGSLITRLNILLYTAPLISIFTFDQFMFGIGFRGLDNWNIDHNVLIISNDLTLFLRLLFELGLLGFISICFICYRVIRYDKILGVILLIIFLSIDQIANYWVLHFYAILFGLSRLPIKKLSA
jgi:hypothetical protein